MGFIYGRKGCHINLPLKWLMKITRPCLCRHICLVWCSWWQSQWMFNRINADYSNDFSKLIQCTFHWLSNASNCCCFCNFILLSSASSWFLNDEALIFDTLAKGFDGMRHMIWSTIYLQQTPYEDKQKSRNLLGSRASVESNINIALHVVTSSALQLYTTFLYKWSMVETWDDCMGSPISIGQWNLG